MLGDNDKSNSTLAVIYLRTSTSEQNPENQLQDCQSINTYGEVQILEEKQSAWKDNKERVQFSRLYELIRQGVVKHLIVWDLDRVYRNRQKLVEFFRLCKQYGCTIHSYRQSWLEELNKIPSPWNDIMFDLLLNVMGWLAEEESRKKSERVKASLRQREGVTCSYKGNKWGRKTLSAQKRNRLGVLVGQGLSMRQMAKELGISVGSVHKYIAQIQAEKKLGMGSSGIDPFPNVTVSQEPST